MLVVQDTGHGMTEAVRARIFEPFFTTKAGTQNSGLGLATVYGIVTRSGGYIWVDSAPGEGTTFRLCFPAVGAAPGRDVGQPAPAARGSGETILVVEDEESVRTLAVRVLRERGYRVLSAEHGRTALAQLVEERIDLLVTDIVMPEMGGRELVERARVERPELAVLLISGYTDSDALRRGVAELGLPFLQKPFAPESLARRVRELLDAKAKSHPPA
jgi:CheY-like chemotaxis protein